MGTLNLESLKLQHAQLDAIIRKEESHVWKNLSKLEELKRAKLKKKDEILRQMLQIRTYSD